MTDSESATTGSWLPLVLIFVLLLLRWVFYGEGDAPVRLRRWIQLQVSILLGVMIIA